MVEEWLTLAQTILQGGRDGVCEAGHAIHATVDIDEIRLDGQPSVPDLPSIPSEHARCFSMTVFDWTRYQNYPGFYCPGQDEVSKSIALQGIWEGYETRVALDILDTDDPGILIDFGAHIGWFTMLALTARRHVLAVDADQENLRLLTTNARYVDGEDRLTVVHGWIDWRTAPLYPGPRIRLVKIDIEGEEREAVRVIQPLLADRLVDWLLIEATPEFPNADVPAMIDDLEHVGYHCYLIPEKGTTLEPDPLAVCRATPVTADTASTLIVHQRSLLVEKP